MIPDRVVAMLFVEGYFVEFWRVIQDRGCSHRMAWADCEETLERYGFPCRYDSYEGFRRMKSYYIDKKSEPREDAVKIHVW
jgi:hypothetical protein